MPTTTSVSTRTFFASEGVSFNPDNPAHLVAMTQLMKRDNLVDETANAIKRIKEAASTILSADPEGLAFRMATDSVFMNRNVLNEKSVLLQAAEESLVAMMWAIKKAEEAK